MWDILERLIQPYEDLMPPYGKSDTVHGEIIRSISKIIYRYFNDGDYFYKGTDYNNPLVSPVLYLIKSNALPKGLKNKFHELFTQRPINDSDYENLLYRLANLCVNYIDSSSDSPNTEDMLEFDFDDDFEYFDEEEDWDWEEDEQDWEEDWEEEEEDWEEEEEDWEEEEEEDW